MVLWTSLSSCQPWPAGPLCALELQVWALTTSGFPEGSGGMAGRGVAEAAQGCWVLRGQAWPRLRPLDSSFLVFLPADVPTLYPLLSKGENAFRGGSFTVG